MRVYVGQVSYYPDVRYKGLYPKEWSVLISDDENYLHEFALQLPLMKREFYCGGHYDISYVQREAALNLGASVSSKYPNCDRLLGIVEEALAISKGKLEPRPHRIYPKA